VINRNRLALVATLLIGMFIGFTGATQRGPDALAQDQPATFVSAVDLVRTVGPAVVTVINEQRFEDAEGSEFEPVGSGTGFFIDQEGHIITNWHVVEGGEQFEVILEDGTVLPAELVGSDQLSDLAVVKIDGVVPATVSLGNSDIVEPGLPVLAIGSALGAFTNTVTQGIVSAIGRDFPGQQTSFYTNLIQHDAAINPGNSGGPLFNFTGEVVGVNTLGIPFSESGDIVQGLFFAIPSSTVKEITATLIENGTVVYPYFGIEFDNLTPDVVSQSAIAVEDGVLVISVVKGGPAESAGVQQGDVIIAIGDIPINQQNSFSEALFVYQPGDSAPITIVRDGEEIQLEITFGERPAS
jgi:S1-C subfamily serine protease